jgi:predicted nucleic acid-binding protein
VIVLDRSALFSDASAFLHQERGALSFTDAAIVVVAQRMGAAVATLDADLRAVPGVTALPRDR